MPYTLTIIRSYGKDKEVYAERGCLVEVVAEHGEVIICEYKGKRFPCRADLLGEVEPEPEIIIIEQEVKPQLSLF